MIHIDQFIPIMINRLDSVLGVLKNLNRLEVN